MNMKQLEVFLAVAECGSFTRGAERVSLTQSTASQHVAALEERLGMRLLERTARGVVPTEAGRTLLARARSILLSIEETRTTMRRLQEGGGPPLVVAAGTVPGTYVVPGLAVRLRKTIPSLRIRLETGDSSLMQEKVVTGEAEVGILGAPVTDGRLVGERVGHDRIILAAPVSHPWKKITLDDLETEPLVLRNPGSGTAVTVNAALRKAGFDPGRLREGVVVGSTEGVRQAIIAGCGPGFLSAAALSVELGGGVVREVEIAGLSIERSFTLVRRRGTDLTPAAEEFCRLARSLAREFPRRGEFRGDRQGSGRDW